MTPKKLIKTTIHLPEKTYEKLRKVSFKARRYSMSQIIDFALNEYFMNDRLGKLLEKLNKEHGSMKRELKLPKKK